MNEGLLTLFADSFNRIDVINMLLQKCFIFLLYFRLKGDVKPTIHTIWQMPLFALIFFSFYYVSIHFTGWRIEFREIIDIFIIAFFMSAVSKAKILDSLIISSIIMVILFIMSMPTMITFNLLEVNTNLLESTMFLLASSLLPLLCAAVLISTYRIKAFKNGISFLLEKESSKSSKRAILTLSFVAIFSFTFLSIVAEADPAFTIMAAIGFFLIVAWNIFENVREGLALSKSRAETIRYRKSEHNLKHSLEEAMNTEMDEGAKELYKMRIKTNQSEKALIVNPANTGVKLIDKYLEIMFKRALNEGVRLNFLINQNLMDFVNKGILITELDQIISNLVNNAMKYAFMGEEGEKIDGKVITLSVIDYTIMLFDTGLPFPDEIIKNLGKFDNTTHGTGTGLPIVIDIVKKYGGTFDIIPSKDEKYGKSIKIAFENFARN